MNLRNKQMFIEASVRSGDLATTLSHLRSGADVNGLDPEGFTPLMIASGLGQPQMVELLLTAGANVHIIDPRMGATALHKAAQSGNTDVIKLLLDKGSFIDQQSPVLGNTPLMDAISYRNEKAVRLLLERGARITILNHWQQTAQDIAQMEALSTIVHLIEERSTLNHEQTPRQTLLNAIQAGDIEAVKRLILAGADLNERVPIIGSPDYNYTPLGIAAREGHADIIRVLLEAGADPRRVIGLMRGTPVHEASYFGHTQSLQVLTERLGQSGTLTPELDAQGPYNGLTALHDAIWQGHLEAAKVLVAAGARLDIKSHAGLTPRELALLYRYDDLALFLAEAEQGPSTVGV